MECWSASRENSTPSFDNKTRQNSSDIMSFTPLDIGDNNENTLDEWREVFDLLDPKDGVSDGQIDKKAFIEWIDTLSFQVSHFLTVVVVTLDAGHSDARSQEWNLQRKTEILDQLCRCQ